MRPLTITAIGRLTLRRELLAHLGAGPGDTVSVDKLPDGEIAIRAVRSGGHISDVFGCLKRDGGSSFSIEKMNEIAAAGWAGKRRRQ